MTKRVDLDLDDFERLVCCLRYAITKTEDIDPSISKFLAYELAEVLDRVTNEHSGSEIAQEIDVILEFIGGK